MLNIVRVLLLDKFLFELLAVRWSKITLTRPELYVFQYDLMFCIISVQLRSNEASCDTLGTLIMSWEALREWALRLIKKKKKTDSTPIRNSLKHNFLLMELKCMAPGSGHRKPNSLQMQTCTDMGKSYTYAQIFQIMLDCDQVLTRV